LADAQSPSGYNGAAWILATHPAAELRNGARAVELATKACELTKWKDASYLDTLAAAYAERGQFDKAVEWQEKAVSLALEADKGGYQARLALYKSGQAYRET
jgi:tetratricopeptide (TPR) repeat protein